MRIFNEYLVIYPMLKSLHAPGAHRETPFSVKLAEDKIAMEAQRWQQSPLYIYNDKLLFRWIIQ